MLLQDILKNYRKQHGFIQEQVAKKIFVTTQAVSKWENGQSVPSIDNLLSLSDLYGISLDELVQGSPFFKKPYYVGCNLNLSLGMSIGILFILYWGILNFLLYVVLFHVTPRELFVMCCIIVNIITFLLMFPAFFDDCWIIENDGIKIRNYSSKNLKKLCQIVSNNLTCKQISYSDISAVEIIYQTKLRMSPFDISPDKFYLRLDSNQKIYHLDLSCEPKIFLPQFISYLSRKGVQVVDKHNIIEMLISGKSLYDYFNNIN